MLGGQGHKSQMRLGASADLYKVQPLRREHGLDVAESLRPGGQRPGALEPLRVKVADGRQARVRLLRPGGKVILRHKATTDQRAPQGR